MRFVLTSLLWLLTTVVLAVAIPSAWAEQKLVDEDGYAALAQRAAGDPALQQAMAAELTTQASALVSDNGGNLSSSVISGIASVYTSSSAFPAQFAQANRFAHRWMFTDSVRSDVDPQGRWLIDLAPMLSDTAFKETLSSYNISLPATLPVPLTENAPAALRPGVLRPAATWGPWASVGAAVLAGILALLTLASSRSIGKGLAALGVSALLVGAAGWAGLEVGRRNIDNALADTSDNVHRIADAMVDHAVASMHQWLNLTLTVGGGLVIIGVIATLLGGLRKSAG